MEDRSVLRLSISAPEGTSYPAMQDYVDRITQFVVDSVPEQQIALRLRHPVLLVQGAANTGFMRLRF